MSDVRFMFEQVEVAMRRCMQANPTGAPEYAMCPDAAALADLYATMLCYGLDSVAAAELGPRKVEAITRWRPPATA